MIELLWYIVGSIILIIILILSTQGESISEEDIEIQRHLKRIRKLHRKQTSFTPKHISDVKTIGWIVFLIYFLITSFIITLLKMAGISLGFFGWFLVISGCWAILRIFRKEKRNFCINCGTKLKNNSNFCTSCGKELKAKNQ